MATNTSSSLEDDDDVLGQYPSASSPLSIDDLMKERAISAAPPAAWTQGFPAPKEETPTQRAPAISAAAAPVDQSSPITPATAPDASNAPAAPAAFPATEEPPAGPNEAAMRDLGTSGLNQLNTNLTGATQAVSEVPTSNPEVDKLDTQIAGTSVPTQLRERLPGATEDTPATDQGKMLPQFAPSLGRRIWRGVEGGLLGLAGGGLPGALVGALKPGAVGSEAYGAPNAAYQRQEAGREQELSTLEDQRKSAFDAWKQSVDAAGKKASEYRANATLGKDLTSGATDSIKADTDALKAANDTPEAKARAKALGDQAEFDSRFARLGALEKRVGKMPPATEAAFLADGKMPDPRQPREPSFEEIALSGLLSRLGHKPTHDEYLAAVQEVRATGGNAGTQTRFDEKMAADLQGKKDKLLGDARNAAEKEYWTPKAKSDYLTAAQAAQDDYEASLRAAGQNPQHMQVNPKTLAFEPAGAPAAGAPPAQAQNQGAPKAGDTRTYQGHTYKFDGQQFVLQPAGGQ